MTATLLPNTFMSFNAYVDIAMELLTPEEYKVLSFAARHILGWQDKVNKRRGIIGLTMFEEGYTTSEGMHFGGTGLGRVAILACLETLTKAGLMVKINDPTPDGQEWELGEQVDWACLLARKAERDAKNRERTEKARQTRAAKAAGLSDIPAVVSPTNQERLVPQTGAGLSDKPKQNHLQNQVVVVDESDQQRWDATLNQLQLQLDQRSFETWIRGAQLLCVERQTSPVLPALPIFVIAVRSSFARDLLQNTYYRMTRRILNDAWNEEADLRFEFGDAESAPEPSDDGNMPLFRLLADQLPAATQEGETIRTLFSRFIAPITEANEASVKLLEAQYSPETFGYALSVMADKQAAGKVNDPLAYTQGILRNL